VTDKKKKKVLKDDRDQTEKKNAKGQSFQQFFIGREHQNEIVDFGQLQAFKQAQLDLLRRDVQTWNKSQKNLPFETDLTGGDLENTNLSGVKLSGFDLRRANFRNADLSEADLSEADLREANLWGANLSRVNLFRAKLSGANLQRVELMGADLGDANLSGVNLAGANLAFARLNNSTLSYAIFFQVELKNTDFLNSFIDRTVFADTDLGQVLNLDKVRHMGPSSISEDTLAHSKGYIPESFLRGCGLTDIQVESAKLYNLKLTNEEILKIQDHIFELRATQALQISPLFISYSHADKEFVDRLDAILTSKGIRFWRDTHDAIAGRLETQIDLAIRQNPTVLLILSRNSLSSDWVQHEVRKSQELQKKLGRDVLCPITLDNSWKTSKWPQRIMEQIMEYNILDFSGWENQTTFDAKFSKLLRGLHLFYKKP
jgi:uncharacterized protein YjbI with pentapeptide repeats